MHSAARIALIALFSMTACAGIASAEPPVGNGLRFTKKMVSGKTMVSSGYSQGSMTFERHHSLTCVGYPSFVVCKTWKIEPDGALHREFTDSHSGSEVTVWARWQLLSQNGSILQVRQTSSNSSEVTTLTVTIK